MSTYLIGQISLNIATLLYFIWFIPQLILTFKRRTTAGLSLSMHAILAVAYITDFVYGFGRHLPIQYKLVTIFGLIALTIEHVQFWRYGSYQKNEKIILHLLTAFFILLFISAIYNLTFSIHSKQFYNFIGFFSLLCWLLFMWPQIVSNFLNQSAASFSHQTVLLSILSGVCDIISAFALDWDWPSKIGALIGLIPKFMLLLQYFYYKNNLNNKAYMYAA